MIPPFLTNVRLKKLYCIRRVLSICRISGNGPGGAVGACEGELKVVAAGVSVYVQGFADAVHGWKFFEGHGGKIHF